MSADKLQGQFDGRLRRALQKYKEPVPADFTQQVLRQINEAEQQRILARLVLQERLALAVSIACGIIAVAATALFPSFVGSLVKYVVAFVGEIGQAVEAVRYEWQFYTVFAGVLAFAAYSLVDLLVRDS